MFDSTSILSTIYFMLMIVTHSDRHHIFGGRNICLFLERETCSNQRAGWFIIVVNRIVPSGQNRPKTLLQTAFSAILPTGL